MPLSTFPPPGLRSAKEHRDATTPVYFVEGAGLVKIGYAAYPLERFAAMLTGCPIPLSLLASMPGGPTVENELPDAHKLGLPIAVIQAARKKLLLMENAKDERDLRNWASLNYKKRKGDQMERRTVRINDQYRIVFVLIEDEHPPAIRVLEIGDTH